MNAIVYGYHINEHNEVKEVNEIKDNMSKQGFNWFHINASHESARAWFNEHTDVPELVIEMMLSKNTRPNVYEYPNGTLVTLRAVNKAANHEIELLNAINIWVTDHMIITSRNQKIMAIEDIVSQYKREEGPLNQGDFIIELVQHLNMRLNAMVANIEEDIEDIEENILENNFRDVRQMLILQRKKIVKLRKYLLPQREALRLLSYEKYGFMNSESQQALKYYYDKLVRLVDDIDIMKEHILLNQEEVSNSQNDMMNKSMYIISVISGLFLPLGFITGLLGVNIGGMPWVDNKYAFIILAMISCIYIGITGVYFLLRKK